MSVEKDEKDLQKILQLVLPSLNKGLEKALSEVFAMWKYFISFQDLSRMILLKLEEKMKLPSEVKEKLRKELERIYREEVATLPVNILRIPQRAPDEYPNFIRPDTQTIRYAEILHDFYLGKFFQGDQEIRRRALNWMSKYYLEKGNPIGRGQKGVQEFLEEFKEYIRPQTEWKARQIIDTSVNYLRNSARLRAFQRARIKYYRWDATNDRLTCSACRSLDGRLFRTEDAVRILDTIEASEDPTIIRELRPIITTPWKGKTADLLTKWPPLHPHCYDEETEVFTNEGWKYFKDLRGDELFFSLNPENPTEVDFVPARKVFSYFYRGEMIRLRGMDIDLCVTPDHQLLLWDSEEKKLIFKEACAICEDDRKRYGVPLIGITAPHYRSKLYSFSYLWEIERYDGLVYGVELEKWHVLFVRRGKKKCFSGNCRCRIVAEEEEVTIPVTVERPSFAKYTPEQMELEKFWGSLTRKEVENRIRAHLGSSWERPVKGEKGVRAWERARQQADEHWRKHGKEFGYTSKSAYLQGAYEIIKNPERVYVEARRGKTNLIFIRGNQVVVSNDDELKILSYYKLREEAEKDIEAALKGGKRDGLIRIL